MTPLGASLIFVFISIMVSLFRHLFFHSSSLNGNDDSNISFTKIHTVTLAQSTPQRQPYNSLYQAYFKPQIPKMQADLPYSSFALKKAILNNEGVYLCQEKYAAIFQQRTHCESSNKSCKWKTSINVYRLPFLKKEESQMLQVDGRIHSREKMEDHIECHPHANKPQSFELNFVVVLNQKESKKGARWAMNSLIIEQKRQGWRKQDFTLRLLKWNLKNITHDPILYSFNEKCLSYVSKEEPWLINYNCAKRWESFNVLTSEVQKALFGNGSTQSPPFKPSHQVSAIFLKHFTSSQKIFVKPEGCEGICPKQAISQEKQFITYVFQNVNSPFKFGKTYSQVTILVNATKNAKLVSFNNLKANLNSEKAIQIDCSLYSKQYKLIKGLYTYQLGLHEDGLSATFIKHSLLCVSAESYNDELKIMQVSDLIGNFNSTETPHDLIMRSRDAVQLRKLEYMFYRRQTLSKKEEPKEESAWLDFDIFSFKYNIEENHEQEVENTEIEGDLVDSQADESEKKGQKKSKNRNRREEKKRSKKGKKYEKEDGKQFKFPEDSTGEKLCDLHDDFADIGDSEPFEANYKSLTILAPVILNSDNKLKIVNGDPDYPLIYLESFKKFLLTYQPKEDEEGKLTNETKGIVYSHKYSHIGAESKIPDLQAGPDYNDSGRPKPREEDLQLDRFLFSITQQQKGGVINNIKSVRVVDARYDEGSKMGLRGHLKPYCRQVIVAWGWGIQVYEVNWDRKALKSQIAEIEEHLYTKQEGIQMATLIPFVQLFATVYCLFQALMTSR